ncbi:MAG: putative ABC transporter periplasmic-binding protein [Methanosaeta sp. PtaU1.Bin112]|nr:MAG: putative ABC transporter periplasmic-binding protein [Methanosaeta sp. PtaU1.Bin112]
MRTKMQLFLAASIVFCILLSGLAFAQDRTTAKSGEVSKLVIGTTDHVEDINVNDGIFNTYREAFLTKSLIRVDQSGNFVPALAESWETEDAKKWTFHLVKNATWHDGTPVTAGDLKFSLEYLPEKLGGSNWKIIDSVQAPDESTLIINLKSQDGNFLTNLLMLRSVPKHVFEKVNDPKKFNEPASAVGCGPYKFMDFEKAAGLLRFQAYDGYYEGKPAVQEIDIRMFKNQEAMMMALLNGELDTIYIYSGGISYYYVPQLIENDNLGYMLIKNSGVPAALWLNENKTPFDDVRFREAISYAIDYQELQNLFTAGYGRTPSAGFIPDGTLNYIETRDLSFNSSRATALLNETGLVDKDGDGLRENADGMKLQPQILVKSDSDSVRLGEMLKKYMSAVGLDAQLKVSDSSGFWDVVDAKEHDMFISRTTPWGMMMEAGYATGYMDTRSNGWPMVNDPAFTELVDDLLAASNAEKTAQLAGSVQEYYARELPAIALYWNDYVQPYNKKYEGYVANPIHGILSYETFYGLHQA